ncbi:MAG: HpcH/HpaI aldolase/citrate lyase family protein [Oceanicaulis sp.]
MTDETAPPRLLRSALFVPGDKPRALEKAPGLAADALMLDLEDAVAPERKEEARRAAPDAVAGFRRAGRRAVIRIAAPDAPELAEDVAAAAQAGPDAVLIAKLESVEDLTSVRGRLTEAGYGGPLWAMIETPRGLLALERLAARSERLGLEAVIAGTNDLAETLRLPEGPGLRTALTPHLARLVLAARAVGVAVLDGVFNAYQDAAGFAAEAEAGRAMGFDGKSLIHPSQVAPANAAFAPSDAEIAWARRVAAAFDDPANAGKGAVPLDGRMVELMHLKSARAVLAAAERTEG